MKRFHIHIGVKNLEESITFYSALFGSEPGKKEADYARWMLDNPAVNFAISTRTNTEGVDHLGIQVDSSEELADLRSQLSNADVSTFDEGQTVCCYANSDKSWVKDPQGVAWEAYHTMSEAKFFSEPKGRETSSDCCVPKEPKAKSKCCG